MPTQGQLSQPCSVPNEDGTGSVLLKEKFSREMQQSRVQIPPKNLAAGRSVDPIKAKHAQICSSPLFSSRYNFTLCVFKKNSSDCASMLAIVKEGDVVTFLLASRDGQKANPREPIEVKGTKEYEIT